MPRRRDIAAERDRNAALEAPHGRCGICHAPLEAEPPRRAGGANRERGTCSNRCRQYRHRHPDEYDRRAPHTGTRGRRGLRGYYF
jgi:hypothetical protein